MIFGAAATVAQMVFDGAQRVAMFLARKVLLLAALTIVLPWVLKGFLIWSMDYIIVYGRDYVTFMHSFVQDILSSSDVTSSFASGAVDFEITGIGGYLAMQTGLIDYCSIIITGWGLYWTVAILAKTPRML